MTPRNQLAYLRGEPIQLVARTWHVLPKMGPKNASNTRENQGLVPEGDTQTFARFETRVSPKTRSKMMLTVRITLFVSVRLTHPNSTHKIFRTLAIFRAVPAKKCKNASGPFSGYQHSRWSQICHQTSPSLECSPDVGCTQPL